MFERLMTAAVRHPRWATALVVGSVVGFAFWEPLFAGATLAPLDLIESVGHPQRAYREIGSITDRASGDLVNIHAHWASFGRSVRGLDGWWDPLVAQGYPLLKGGLPVFALTYVVTPAWFAAGATAVLRTLTAWALTSAWLRRFGLRRSSVLVGGAAYAFSGFMVGWGGWPHASVAAFAPGVLWGVERAMAQPSARAGVPIGVLLAAMVWANSPLVLAYLVIGVVLYTVCRSAVEHRRDLARAAVALAPAGFVAGVVAFGLSYPHVRFFPQWLDSVDTSHRQFAADSSAGIDYLLTVPFSAAFGTDGHGPAFFARGNWVEFQTFVGLGVVLLALFATAAARGDGVVARRRRGAIAALWILVAVGALVGYVGGPATEFAQAVMGDVSGLATRSKVLISLGFAGLVAFGFEAWIDPSASADRARRRVAPRAAAVGILAALVMLPALLRWVDLTAEVGARRDLAVVVLPHLAAGAAIVVVMAAVGSRRLAPPAVPILLAAAVVGELLWFARPIPTVFDADEVFEPLAEHELVIDELGAGERLGGSNQTFWPAATQAFDIATIGGQTLTSPGFRALLEAVDPIVYRAEAFGTPTYPSIPPTISPALSVWDVLGVRVWASAPSHAPPGPRVEPAVGFAMDDLARDARSGTLVVPEGGLRAVIIDAIAVEGPGRIDVVVETDDLTVETWMPQGEIWPGERHGLAIPIAGEALAAGSIATVTVRTTGGPGALLAGVTADGDLTLGSIAGADDGLEMISTGAVTMLRRAHAAPFRLHDAAIVEADLDTAAGLVVDRPAVAGSAVVLADAVDLPSTASPDAALEVVTAIADHGRIAATVETDRPAVLVLPAPVYPGWTATVNGVETPVLTADTAFAAVLVPAGSSEVELRFRPDGLGIALVVFFATVLGTLILWFAPPRNRRARG
ncbi:MAG: YfhO family protein [Actinomycetota bacterium]